MKRFYFAFLGVLAVLFMSAPQIKAQNYLLDYGPGSISWYAQQQQLLMSMQAQTNAMRMNVLNYYRNQADAATRQMMTNPFAPLPGALTSDGVYLTPDNINNYTEVKVACEHCDNGYVYTNRYWGNGNVSRSKSRCSFCHGNGYVTKHVSVE